MYRSPTLFQPLLPLVESNPLYSLIPPTDRPRPDINSFLPLLAPLFNPCPPPVGIEVEHSPPSTLPSSWSISCSLLKKLK
uniref:Candidate secreted effector n=1 Tax=Meloidogyne incognita TaxID=6306 RepID=A0A914L242_MELIC